VERRPHNVVFVVCHPDDEALWVGGLLHGLSTFPFLRVHVICLSGADPASPRQDEFDAARAEAGYAAGVVLGGPLRPAVEPLPPTPVTTEAGLQELGLSRDAIDLLITHPPYGDEHANPHHRQTFRELRAWAREHEVPFGFFSGIPVPFFSHTPLLRQVKREGELHLLALARCVPVPDAPEDYRYPAYFVQFLADMRAKARALGHYRSIDVDAHVAGYAAWTSACESLYLLGERALRPFTTLIDTMTVPGGVEDLFASSDEPARSGAIQSTLRRVVPAGVRRVIRHI
jgi:LmbE family N-acetylglucosaminyl deacetylase